MVKSKAYLSFVLHFAFLISSHVLTHELPEGESSPGFFHPNNIVSMFFSQHTYRDSEGCACGQCHQHVLVTMLTVLAKFL